MTGQGRCDHSVNAKHFRWDRRREPCLRIRSGAVVEFVADDVVDGQLPWGCGTDAFARIDKQRTYPLAGPVFVDGAMPGDALDIEIIEVEAGPQGWAAIFPGEGLLQQEFCKPYIRHFDLSGGDFFDFSPDIRIPIAPFCGTMGVAPAAEGLHSIRPPTPGAGNIDIRHLRAGSVLTLPVLVEGALFSLGDGHAAQGDGEVCGTGLECPVTARVRLSTRSGAAPKPGTCEIRSSVARLPGPAGTTGFSAWHEDPRAAAMTAVTCAIDWLEKEHGLTREDAYLLCSLAADLSISQIVNDPHATVSCLIPNDIFHGRGHGLVPPA